MSNMDNDWQTCKSRNLCRWHGPAETCEADWFNRGLHGFASDTLVEGPSSGEECKWGRCRCLGAGAMGNGLLCRETQQSRGSNDGSRGANPTLGEGAPVKLSSCWGVAWNDGWTGVRDRSVETAGLGCGLQDGLDEIR